MRERKRKKKRRRKRGGGERKEGQKQDKEEDEEKKGVIISLGRRTSEARWNVALHGETDSAAQGLALSLEGKDCEVSKDETQIHIIYF